MSYITRLIGVQSHVFPRETGLTHFVIVPQGNPYATFPIVWRQWPRSCLGKTDMGLRGPHSCLGKTHLRPIWGPGRIMQVPCRINAGARRHHSCLGKTDMSHHRDHFGGKHVLYCVLLIILYRSVPYCAAGVVLNLCGVSEAVRGQYFCRRLR